MSGQSPYDERYAEEGYYWGTRPSDLADRVIEIVQPDACCRPRLLDLGCGEGRDAIHLARHGFAVVGLDLSCAGLEKMVNHAGQDGVQVQTIHADIATYRLTEPCEVIFSVGALHYLAPERRQAVFEHYKQWTSPGGLNAFSVFVAKPFLEPAPDPQGNAQLYRSGEVMSHYWDWEILFCEERIVKCRSGGIAHRHAIAEMIARKPASLRPAVEYSSGL